jgi:hypothetical protein
MALVVAVVRSVSSTVLGSAAAYEVYGGSFGRFESLPEKRTPTDDFRDAVAEGHVPNCGVGGLHRGSRDGSEKLEGKPWRILSRYHGSVCEVVVRTSSS